MRFFRNGKNHKWYDLWRWSDITSQTRLTITQARLTVRVRHPTERRVNKNTNKIILIISCGLSLVIIGCSAISLILYSSVFFWHGLSPHPLFQAISNTVTCSVNQKPAVCRLYVGRKNLSPFLSCYCCRCQNGILGGDA